MIYAVVFLLGLLILIIAFSFRKKDNEFLSEKFIKKFTKWAESFYHDENFKIVINKNKITTTSKSLEIVFDGKENKGFYHDIALNQVFTIIYLNKKFHILEE